jgi:hypothetical protein
MVAVLSTVRRKDSPVWLGSCGVTRASQPGRWFTATTVTVSERPLVDGPLQL